MDADRFATFDCYGTLIDWNSGIRSTLARLYSIATAPAARGRGLGATLLAAAEDAARARNCRALRLEVRVDNTAAIALYERAGYRRIGRYREYYEDGEDAWRYEKALMSAGHSMP